MHTKSNSISKLIDRISRSLNEENSEVNRKYWSNFLITTQVKLDDIKAIIHHPHPIGIRFSWMLGNLCELKPEMLAPVFPYLFSNRNNIQIPNFNRSLAKMCFYVDLPEQLEGEIMSALFEWLVDPKTIVTTKHFCLKALYKLSLKYPAIKSELKLTIEEQMHKYTTAFDKQLQLKLALLE